MNSLNVWSKLWRQSLSNHFMIIQDLHNAMDSLQWISTILVHIYWTFIMLQQKYFKKKIAAILFKRPKTVKAYFWRFHRLEPLLNKYYKNLRFLLNFRYFYLTEICGQKCWNYCSYQKTYPSFQAKPTSFTLFLKNCPLKSISKFVLILVEICDQK